MGQTFFFFSSELICKSLKSDGQISGNQLFPDHSHVCTQTWAKCSSLPFYRSSWLNKRLAFLMCLRFRSYSCVKMYTTSENKQTDPNQRYEWWASEKVNTVPSSDTLLFLWSKYSRQPETKEMESYCTWLMNWQSQQ